MRLFVLLTLLVLLVTRVNAEVRTLADFNSHLDRAASVLKAQADLEAQQFDLLAKEAQKGLELFGSVAAGYQKSPFAREPFGRFFNPTARLGLRYPLLGSAERQQRAIRDAATQIRIEDIRLEWSKQLAALFMEENYAAYWSAQKMLALNSTYMQQRKGIGSILKDRQEAGLLLTSDYFTFLSNFERAEQARMEFSDNKDQALMRLVHLTDTNVTPFKAIKPSLGKISSYTTYNVNQSDLEILQVQIDNLRKTNETENWQGIDSNVSATVFGGPAIPFPSSDSPQFGYGGALGFNFRMPLEIASFRKNEKSRLNSQLISLQTEHTHRNQELYLEFNSTLNRYQQLEQRINFQRTQLDAARESVREQHLRLQVLDGDVFEQYIRSISIYYRAAVEYLETETEQWKQHIRLRQFVSVSDYPEVDIHLQIDLDRLIEPLQQSEKLFWKQSSAKIKMPKIPVKKPEIPANKDQLTSDQLESVSDGFAVYVWNYDKVMTQPGFWKQSQARQINRILLSLNAAQITSVVSNPQALNDFLNDARSHDIKVELLLGDPNWILPEEREGLLNIIKKLRHINFNGLHLDIEPDQLEVALTGKNRLEELIKTIQQVKTISPWPIGISIHPRYLLNETSYGICFPCQISRIGVSEVVVMYYSLNVQNVVVALKYAMKKHPDLTFSLAQSLERELGVENSYVHKPRKFFNKTMQQLHNQLDTPNFGGIIIQSWQDWEDYIYENPL